MNRENIQKVRDVIAATKPRRFSMKAYFGIHDGQYVDDNDVFGGQTTNAQAVEGSCKTCACIAGHTMAVLRPDRKTPRDVFVAAKNLLGLSEATAQRLFLPHDYDGWFGVNMSLGDVKLPHAVRVLDHLLATGEVDWKSTRRVKRADTTEPAVSPGMQLK